ncbi:MAG: hypothetical protein KDD32_00480 [Bacteroidetes bacterium]|nr:hypothetical protein [Bacteroidota bacterium]
MKKFNYLLGLLMAVSFFACDEEIVTYEEDAIDFQTADAYIKVVTEANELVEGQSDYSFRFIMIPGVEDIAKVNVYKKFIMGGTQEETNEVLAYSYDIDDTQLSTNIEESFRMSDLVEGIEVTDPESVLDTIVDSLVSGTICIMRFEVLRSDGSAANTTDEDAKEMRFTYLPNPFKGTYVVTYSDYWRIERQCIDPGPCPVSDLPIDWVGETRIIGALNDTALTKGDFWGPNDFAWDGEMIFYVGVNDATNPTDSSLRLTIPTEINGEPAPVFSGSRILTVEADGCGAAGSFNHNRVPGQCDVMVVPDAGGPGVHRIYLTYGYFSDGSGEREFYEILQKIGD